MVWILLGVLGFVVAVFCLLDSGYGGAFLAFVLGFLSICYGVGFDPSETELFQSFANLVVWFFQPLR